MKLTLIRDTSSDYGTFGTIEIDGKTYHTIERPWLDNEPNVSCIPTGTYTCIRSQYYRGGYECFEVRGVPKRTLIKIHAANYPNQLNGCIAPGLSRDESIPAVWKSKIALNEIMEHLEGVSEFTLEIKDETD